MSQSDYWTEFMQRRLSRRRLMKAGTLAGAGLLAGSVLGCGSGGGTSAPTATGGGSAQGQATAGAQPTATRGPLTGQVTFAQGSAIAYQTGGDGSTHMGGLGPFIGDTLNEPLVGLNLDLSYYPTIATSWKYSPDLRTVEFTLRKDIKFHNGAPVTAQDVKFSIERSMRPELKWVLGNAFRREVKSIEAVSDNVLRINQNSSFPGLFKRLWWDTPIYPQKYVEQVGDAGFADKPIGAGPFKWVDYKQDQYMTMEAVPDHYRQVPGFKTLKFVYVADDSTRLAMLKSGEADIASLSGPMLEQVRQDPNLKVLEIQYGAGTTITYCDLLFPDEPSPFLNLKVRQAVSLAIDRETIVKKVLFGAAVPTLSALCPYHLGYDKNFPAPKYDPKQAKALLAEAGYPNGIDTVWNLVKTNQYWVEAVVAYLNDVGIRTKLNVMEAGAYQTALFDRKLKGLIVQISYYDVERNPFADVEDGYRAGTQGAYFQNADVEALMDKGSNAATDDEIAKLGAQLNTLITSNELKTQLWGSTYPYGYRADKILKWESQVGSIPVSRFEYMQVKV